MTKKPCFRGPLDTQQGKWVKTSHLVIHIFLRLFVNTLAVNENYYPFNGDNLTQPIQMQLSQKQKTFFVFFLAILKSILNFKHLREKYAPRSSCISGNTRSEKYGYINV